MGSRLGIYLLRDARPHRERELAGFLSQDLRSKTTKPCPGREEAANWLAEIAKKCQNQK